MQAKSATPISKDRHAEKDFAAVGHSDKSVGKRLKQTFAKILEYRGKKYISAYIFYCWLFPGWCSPSTNLFLVFMWSEGRFQGSRQAAGAPGVKGLRDSRDLRCAESRPFYGHHLPYMLSQLSQLSLIGEMLQSLHHLYGPSLNAPFPGVNNILCHCLGVILIIFKASHRSSFDSSAALVVIWSMSLLCWDTWFLRLSALLFWTISSLCLIFAYSLVV